MSRRRGSQNATASATHRRRRTGEQDEQPGIASRHERHPGIEAVQLDPQVTDARGLAGDEARAVDEAAGPDDAHAELVAVRIGERQAERDAGGRQLGGTDRDTVARPSSGTGASSSGLPPRVVTRSRTAGP